ncbi:MAG TPA: hypothetical protein VFJ47_13800, partial [Terriglobales bacterium]|nr:hypothetical protein [Terriglobales bacterium]
AGTGASGPHATNVTHLLERNYSFETPPAVPGQAASGISFAVSNYAVCDKCHDVQGVVMRDVTFKHTEHVLTDAAACSTCHDAHSSTLPMLVNFDTSMVAPNSSGVLNYTRTGTGHGTCNLMCHAHNHAGSAY